VRAGLATFPVVEDFEMDPRTALGLYVHFGESEGRRLEGGLDYLPDAEDASENFYYSLRFAYVRYIGRQGLFYWSAGGGVIRETWYQEEHTFGFAEAGLGYWLGLGQKGLDLRLAVQAPVGEDQNVFLATVFSASYDF
jgi:hypothetical protein